MTRKIKRSDFIFLSIATALSAGVLTVSQLFFPYVLSSTFFGFNRDSVDSDVVIVAIDDKTLNSSGFKRYQDIGRCDYSTLLKNLVNAEPKAVAVDVFFSQGSERRNCDRELTDLLSENPNVFVGTEYDERKKEIVPIFDGTERVENVALVNTNGYHPAEALVSSVFGVSHESDTRNSILFYALWRDISILPIAVAAYRAANGMPRVNVTEREVEFEGGKKFPHQEGRSFINFFTADYPKISFIDVIDGRFDPEFLRGKTVFVGATAHDIHDEFYTPYDTRNFMSGVMIHANAYNTFSANKPLSMIPFWLQLALGMAFSLAFVWLLLSSPHILRGAAFGAAFLFSVILASAGAFVFSGVFVETFPFIAVSVVLGFAVYLRKFSEERQSKNEIRSMFSKYVSVDVANELIEGGVENLGLGGREREVTVFFSDIAGFTDLSEKLSPENLGKILNTYFEEMSSIILTKRGTIDKFIGDAVMAFWNAPIEQSAHAALACEAAILQRQALENVRAEIRRLGCDAGIDMRIGINTGKAVIGNFGCSNRYDYTALGDSVNLASRLESINKQYGTNLIISQSTFDQLPEGKFLTRELDMITVKGKNEPVRIYELLGFNDLGETEKLKLYKDALSHMRSGEKDAAISEFKKIWDIPSRNFVKKLQEMKKIERYSDALKLYREKKFAEAKIRFEAIGDEPSKRFIDRCDEFIKNPPDKEWDSVYRFKTK